MNFKPNFLDNSDNSSSNFGNKAFFFSDNNGKENLAILPKSELKNRILEKVRVNKMTNSNYFKIYNIFLILAILVLSGFSIFLLAGFLADLNEINTISDDFWVNLWQNSFLEFILLASFIGSLIFLIYRQTDWFLVRHVRILVVVILTFITIFGIIGSFFIKKHLETLQSLENFSYRRNRITNLGQKMKEKSAFIGKINQINKNQNWLKITNKYETKIFYWQNEIQKTETPNVKIEENKPNINLVPNLGNNLGNSVGNSENNNLEKKRKQGKNQNKQLNQNLNQIINQLEIGERVLVYFETIEGRMVIMDLKIL